MMVMWSNRPTAGVRPFRAAALAAAALLLPAGTQLFPQPLVCAQQQLSTDEQAGILLNSARRAYNDRNYTQAITHFREFVQKFPNHADLPAAQFGLGLALIDGPRDYPAAAEVLAKSAAAKSPDQPMAAYFHGNALRALGDAELKAATGKPQNEADVRRAAANAKFAESEKQFQAAAAAWVALGDAAEDKLARDQWTVRALCDIADVALRQGKSKEAITAAISAQEVLRKHKNEVAARHLTYYLIGQARFALKEYVSAGKALSQLAPFDQEYAAHVRYLLARIHHLSDERAEAALQYKETAAGIERVRAAAKQELQQNAATLPADRKAYLESAANGPLPDFAIRAGFYQAVLLSDEGKFPEARELFAKFAATAKDHPLASEAQLRVGYCHLQAKQFQDAVNALTPLKDHTKLGDQASWWLARAQLGLVDPNNADATKNAAVAAAALMRVAADRATTAAAAGDATAKHRRFEILMDLADTLGQTGQHRESATAYQIIAAEGSTERSEEGFQRYCTALHLAGAYTESDAACERFEKKFPKSTLLPAVWFRSAENAFLVAGAAIDKPEVPRGEKDRLLSLAVQRYTKLIDKYPEFAQVNMARLGLAQAYYRLGDNEKCIATLVKLPEAERNGELAVAYYLHGDALLRTFPPETDDAVQAAGLIQSAEQAAKFFEAFATGSAKSPLVPDAWLKRGYCYQRMAALLAEKPERDKAIQLARESYEKHQQQFRDHPTTASVVFERAKLMAMAGDVGGATNELRRFQQPPLNTAGNAPLAALRLATLLRSQGQPKEAADLLARIRAEQGAALQNDPARADWLPMLQYEQAMAIKEQNKPAEARPLFIALADKFPDLPEGISAAWRAAQCRREELSTQAVDAKKKLNSGSTPPPEIDTARQTLTTVAQQIAAAQEPLVKVADTLSKKPNAGSEAHLRVLYELAWCDRAAGDAEYELARHAARKALREKIQTRQPRVGNPPAQPAIMPLPDVPTTAIPPADGERRARERYQQIITAGGDKPTAVLAMFELSELVADRGEYPKAIELLNKALLAGPPQELAERIRLRLAACFIARADGKTAEQAARPVSDTIKPNAPVSAIQAEARFLLAESAIQQQDWPKAIERLVPFRDQGPYQNISGVSDRALLRLGQSYAQSNQWDAARQAFDLLLQRYPQSPFADEARFGVGFALQNKGQHDEAVNTYMEVTRRTASEIAARAMVHVGLTRIAQKRHADAATALLAVPYLYDYPEWSAAACYEAARAYKELQKPQEAVGLFKRVIDDYPQSKAAPLARARLDEMK